MFVIVGEQDLGLLGTVLNDDIDFEFVELQHPSYHGGYSTYHQLFATFPTQAKAMKHFDRVLREWPETPMIVVST